MDLAVEAARIETEYEAAQHGAILVAQPSAGLIRAEGRDRLDLLHRMSTNDLATLQPGQGRPLTEQTINGMRVTEGAPVFGIALETPAADQNIIYVFVTLR